VGPMAAPASSAAELRAASLDRRCRRFDTGSMLVGKSIRTEKNSFASRVSTAFGGRNALEPRLVVPGSGGVDSGDLSLAFGRQSTEKLKRFLRSRPVQCPSTQLARTQELFCFLRIYSLTDGVTKVGIIAKADSLTKGIGEAAQQNGRSKRLAKTTVARPAPALPPLRAPPRICTDQGHQSLARNEAGLLRSSKTTRRLLIGAGRSPFGAVGTRKPH